MFKFLSSCTKPSTDDISDSRVWNIKFLSAIALFGILLSISDSSRFLRQVGKSLGLFAGGAVAATTLLQTKENPTKTHHLQRALQIAHEQQVTDMFAAEEQRQQILGELYESVTAEFVHLALLSVATKTNAAAQNEIAQAQVRIVELEAAIAQKTTLATEMLTELEAEATNTFNQFSAKIATQDTLINNLHQQIESLSAVNTTLTAQQTNQVFASIGADPTKSHNLLNRLVKN